MALCGGSARWHLGNSIQVSMQKFGSGAVYICGVWLRGRAEVTCVQMGWQKKIWSTTTQDLAKLLQLLSFSLTAGDGLS